MFYSILSCSVPPVYTLESAIVKAEAGTNVSVKFSVVSDLHSGNLGPHTLKKEGHETITTPYKITENEIVFKNVSAKDGGIYKVSCRNEAGEGSAVFALDISPPKGTCTCVKKLFYPIITTFYKTQFHQFTNWSPLLLKLKLVQQFQSNFLS